MADVSERDEVESRVNRGLLGQWYVIAKSADVHAGKPYAVKALGRDLVLWRTDDGKIGCVEDRCPHRGAPLSRGLVLEGGLSCRYHGVTMNADGVITRVPAMADCPLEGRKVLQSYTVVEANDGVFAYFPSAEHPDPIALTFPYEFTDGEHVSFLCTSSWDCNYRYALDNLVDPMHGPYLHADTFTLAYGAKQDAIRIVEQDDGFAVTRVGQRGENFDWMEAIMNSAAQYCRVEIPYPKAAGPGGPLRVLCFITPIDERSSQIFFWRTRKVSGLERELWRFMFRARLEERHWFVLEQDREILSVLPDNARSRELLYQHDIGVAHLRRVLARKAAEQIEFEQVATRQAAQ